MTEPHITHPDRLWAELEGGSAPRSRDAVRLLELLAAGRGDEAAKDLVGEVRRPETRAEVVEEVARMGFARMIAACGEGPAESSRQRGLFDEGPDAALRLWRSLEKLGGDKDSTALPPEHVPHLAPLFKALREGVAHFRGILEGVPRRLWNEIADYVFVMCGTLEGAIHRRQIIAEDMAMPQVRAAMRRGELPGPDPNEYDFAAVEGVRLMKELTGSGMVPGGVGFDPGIRGKCLERISDLTGCVDRVERWLTQEAVRVRLQPPR